MKYDLKFMDSVLNFLIGTKAEITPCTYIKFDVPLDEEKLRDAVEVAIKRFPLVGCSLHNKSIPYFETNNAPLPIYHGDLKTRPLKLGKETNGYAWQISFNENEFCMDRCHAVSDGRGWLAFLNTLLNAYFGEPLPDEIPLDSKNIEDFVDFNEKGYYRKKSKKGFKRNAIRYKKNHDDEAVCHILKADMKQVLEAAHKVEASPATIFAPLFSRALRKHLKPGTKNREVSCLVPVDVRKTLGFDTFRNGIANVSLNYIDKMDDMDLAKVSTIYRATLDLQVQRESLVKNITDQYKQYKNLLKIKTPIIRKTIAKIAGSYAKDSYCNFVLTYLGKANFAPKVMEHIVSYNNRSWHQFQDCNIAAIDVRGTLYITLMENYEDDVVKDFIEICKDAGIDLVEIEKFNEKQAVFVGD